MTSSSVETGAGSVDTLQSWLCREDTHGGAAEELDWLVDQARKELAAAEEPDRATALAAQLAQWAAAEGDAHSAGAALMHACQLAQDGGQAEQASHYCQQALERDPANRDAAEALQQLAAARAGDTKDAASTLPYAVHSPLRRPSSGIAAPASVSTRDNATSQPARSGGTLPFRPQVPVQRSHLPRAEVRSRAWLPWAGSAALLALIAFALLNIGGEAPPTPDPDERDTAAASSTSAPATTAPAGPQETAAPEPKAPPRRVPEAKPRRTKQRRTPEPRARRSGSSRRIGGVMVDGDLVRVEGAPLNRAALMKRLVVVQRKLARCYRTLRRHEPKAGGLIEYAWVVRPGGKPAKVRPLSGSLEARAVRLCGIRALRSVRYPSPKEGTAQVRAVFDFSPP